MSGIFVICTVFIYSINYESLSTHFNTYETISKNIRRS